MALSSKKMFLVLSSTLAVMVGAAIAPALPQIQLAFSELPWIDFWVQMLLAVSAFAIALSSPFMGWVIDSIGRKTTFLLSLLISALAGSAGLYLNEFFLLLGSRALLGLGVAGVMTATTTLIADYFMEDERAEMMGLQAAIMGVGGVVFLTLGGVLSDWSWRAPFAMYLLVIALIPWGLRVIREPKGDDEPDRSITSEKGLPWGTMSLIYWATFIGMVFFYLVPITVPFHLTHLFGYSGTVIGLVMGICNLFGAISSLLYPRIHRLYSYVTIFGLLFLVISVGYFCLMIAQEIFLIGVGLGLIGVGIGLVLPNGAVWLTEVVPERVRGRSIGVLTMSFFLGQFASPFFATPLIHLNGYAGEWGVYYSASLVSFIVGALFLLRKV